MTFDGSDQYMMAQPATPDIISGSFTVEAWAKPADDSATMPVVATGGGSDYGFRLELSGGDTIKVDIGDGESWLAEDSVDFSYQTGSWYHLACSVTPDGYTLYVDGKEVGSGSFTGTPTLRGVKSCVQQVAKAFAACRSDLHTERHFLSSDPANCVDGCS